MKIRAVIFDIRHEPQVGKENTWEWFCDPHRNIVLAKTGASFSPPPAYCPLVLEIKGIPIFLENYKLQPEEVLFVSDLRPNILQAQAWHLHTMSILPENSGEFMCHPPLSSDRLAGYVLFIEHRPKT